MAYGPYHCSAAKNTLVGDIDFRCVPCEHNLVIALLPGSFCSQSLAIGRPPSIHQSFADCEFPTDEEATLSNSGEVEYGCKPFPSFLPYKVLIDEQSGA